MSLDGNISFEVLINNSDKFKTLIKEVNSEAITFLLTESTLYFIYLDTGFYVCKTLNTIDMRGYKNPVAIRIDKGDFINLLTDSKIEFTLNQEASRLILKYFDSKDELLYSYKLPYQPDLIGTYLDTLNSFSKFYDYPQIDFTKANTIIKIAKTLQLPISCDGTSLRVDNGNMFVYQPFESMPFNINSKLLYLLRSYSNKVYVIKEYFAVVIEDVIIAVNRYKSAGKHDFEYIRDSKSSFIIKFNLSNVIKLSKKIKLSAGEFFLNFNKKIAYFESNGKEYEAKFTVTNTKSSVAKMSFEEYMMSGGVNQTLPEFKLPNALFRGVFSNINHNSELTLYVKKSFVTIICENLYVVIGKSMV